MLFSITVISVCMLSATVAIAANGLRDPTRPADYQEGSAKGTTKDEVQVDTTGTGWKLDSTLMAGNRKLAIINGVLVKKGDKVGNMVVVDIKPTKALLRVNNENVEVMLVQSSVKSKASYNSRKK